MLPLNHLHAHTLVVCLLSRRVMSVGQDGGLTRHDMTTRCFLGVYSCRHHVSYSCLSCQTTQVVCGLDHWGGLPSDTGWSVGDRPWDSCSRSWEHAVWSCHVAWAAASSTVCLSQAPCTAAGTITRDHVVVARAWRVPDCHSMLKFRLSTINRLIHNRLSITEKLRK